MPLSDYGRNLYADIIVGSVTSAPAMYLTFTDAVPSPTDDGSTIGEVSGSRYLLVPGSWTSGGTGVRLYTTLDSIELVEDVDYWGYTAGYAIMNTPIPGTGDMLFYGSMTPVTLNGPAFVDITSLGIEVPA